ncbi:FMN-binding protein [Schnuerera sp.]|uniref:FMN-binding protein n=1 Tax=Schnuerera sp. TaxID=2794844 RepID=UPI002D7E8AF6|nr:FMN-binding protein [Schnuerera sp.]
MMKSKKFYLIFLIIVVTVVIFLFSLKNRASEEELKVKGFYPEAKKIELVKDISDDMFISLNFPGVKRAYEVDGQVKVFVVSCVGYNGPIDVLTAIDDDELLGIEILEHEESLDYAEHIEEDWFLERFKNIVIEKYLNLVVLDKENPEDIVQVTGATVSSQAVVNAVNAAIGAYQYKVNDIEMEGVADVVPQEMWQKDTNSFAINWEDESIRIDIEKIKEYEQLEMDVVLINTTGTETDMKVKGPTLRHILEKEGLNLRDYEGVGISGRDGYYTMVDREKLEVNDVILVWQVNGKDLKEEEKPVRIAIPNELGPYWVKMVSSIDLYGEISPKAIDKVHIFAPLTEDIEPYYYEYYGSKDKSIEVGQILRKFDNVDEKGFFTMAASDGLIKNETLSLVRQRYFLKVEGDNAPMNIAPNFKLGMNVKNMTHFSTTKDAVIFPEKMVEVVRTKDINGSEGLLLEDVLLTAGMRWTDNNQFNIIGRDDAKVEITLEEMLDSYIVDDGNIVVLYQGESEIMKDILRIEKK